MAGSPEAITHRMAESERHKANSDAVDWIRAKAVPSFWPKPAPDKVTRMDPVLAELTRATEDISGPL